MASTRLKANQAALKCRYVREGVERRDCGDIDSSVNVLTEDGYSIFSGS